jgi:diguanylate cyclase
MSRDPLTGLSTKHSFLDDLERRLAEWRRGGAPIGLIMLEIDKFEGTAKQFGQAAADTIVKVAAQFLKATMRDMDHCARWDQRRFALMLPGATSEDAAGVAERLRTAIENCKLPVQGSVLQFTVSVGVTEVAGDDTVAVVTNRALALVISAQQQGGNCCLCAEHEETVCSAAEK